MAKSKSYKTYVAAQTQRYPRLKSFSTFLADSNVTPRPCQVVSLQFSSSVSTPVRRDHDANSLNTLLSDQVNHDNSTVGTILIVEDLSKEITEIIGLQARIDPLFFASYIDVPAADISSPRHSIEALPSRVTAHGFLNFDYHQTLKFDPPAPSGMVIGNGNITRKVAVLPLMMSTSVGFARHCCSILKTQMPSGAWLSIVLVDPPTGDTYQSINRKTKEVSFHTLRSEPFQGVIEDILHLPPSFDDLDDESFTDVNSMLEHLVRYWSKESPAGFNQNSPTLLSMSYPTLRLIAAEWMKYVEVMYHAIKQYEYSVSTSSDQLELFNKLDSDLRQLQSWSRRSMASLSKLSVIVNFIKSCNAPEDREIKEILLEDYNYITTIVEKYSVRLKAAIPMVTSMIQIADSRQAFEEASNVSRLTYLALIFIPLSFLTGLFSMSEPFGPGGDRFWLYFAVAIPVCIAVIFIARPPIAQFRSLMRWMSNLRNR